MAWTNPRSYFVGAEVVADLFNEMYDNLRVDDVAIVEAAGDLVYGGEGVNTTARLEIGDGGAILRRDRFGASPEWVVLISDTAVAEVPEDMLAPLTYGSFVATLEN